MQLPPDEALFAATYIVGTDGFQWRRHRFHSDVRSARILRSVLMKPESEDLVPQLHRQLTALLQG